MGIFGVLAGHILDLQLGIAGDHIAVVFHTLSEGLALNIEGVSYLDLLVVVDLGRGDADIGPEETSAQTVLSTVQGARPKCTKWTVWTVVDG